MAQQAPVKSGTLSFSIEGRILRELGERLVKHPHVAVLELVKNAHDADATICGIAISKGESVVVSDNGSGMTFRTFADSWMRIGTSSKEASKYSEKYSRAITGEKGIGRFAVRFLGRHLRLDSVAFDSTRNYPTRLTAEFDWRKFDIQKDLEGVTVPYRLYRVPSGTATGTVLTITKLRNTVDDLDLRKVRTGSLGVLSPLRSLFVESANEQGLSIKKPKHADPGLQLEIQDGEKEESGDVGAAILSRFVLKATLKLEGDRFDLRVYRRGHAKPYLAIRDKFQNSIEKLSADIRFFPRRAGTFADLPVDGRVASTWVFENGGVAVFDRNFRVQPYGSPGDDWLSIQADATRNFRIPRSTIAKKHFPMTAQVQASTTENWMLRLPEIQQVVGLVQVEGKRVASPADTEVGLIASADREGFVENETFKELVQLIRGAVEAIAYSDREIQLEEDEERRKTLLASIRRETRSAILDVQSNPNIPRADKAKIVTVLAENQQRAEKQEQFSREREQQLEVMSLLGVVAGFMTHEFGVALQELEATQKELTILAKSHPKLGAAVSRLAEHIKGLRDFVTYSQGYIRGSKIQPDKPYPVKPRLQQVKRVFGRYAEERKIEVQIGVDEDLMAPLVPAALYNGLALNLYTNALKAVAAAGGKAPGIIAFRAWNEDRWHYLEVSDTGIGIPATLHERVFDPLFSTTSSNRDPLGSGMGLGLSLVRRGAEAFGGRADVVEPPSGFATCIRIRLPNYDQRNRQ